MNKGQIISWFQETATMVQNLAQFEEALAKTKANLDLAEQLNDGNQLMQLNNQLNQIQTAIDKVVPLVLDRTKTSSLENARQFITDLGYKIEQADQHYQQWRKTVVAFEYAVTANELAEDPEKGPTRAQYEEHMGKLETKYNTSLELASAHIPSAVRLIHV